MTDNGLRLASDSLYLNLAVREARYAFRNGYSPVGAVLVGGDRILSIQHSTREIGNIDHAEYKALMGYNIQEKYPDATLYTTLEPCIMCVGIATVLKVSRIVWLVNDVWAGVQQVYNWEAKYVKTRFPKLEPVGHMHQYKDVASECLIMWEVYLKQTGHGDAVGYMLGVDECK